MSKNTTVSAISAPFLVAPKESASTPAFQVISAGESYIWIVDTASGEKKLVTPKGGEKVSYSGVTFARDGKSLFVATDRESEFQRLARLDLASGAHT